MPNFYNHMVGHLFPYRGFTNVTVSSEEILLHQENIIRRSKEGQKFSHNRLHSVNSLSSNDPQPFREHITPKRGLSRQKLAQLNTQLAEQLTSCLPAVK
jgi:hypothetical protein